MNEVLFVKRIEKEISYYREACCLLVVPDLTPQDYDILIILLVDLGFYLDIHSKCWISIRSTNHNHKRFRRLCCDLWMKNGKSVSLQEGEEHNQEFWSVSGLWALQ